MVAINPEMLRELLDEFTEKEEVTREEMNAINQQIAELEKRIESSKVKLAGLNKDREKIDLMRERYLSGNWKFQLSNMAGAVASSGLVSGSVSDPAPTAAPSPLSHAEGRAARRAVRETASQPAAGESNESYTSTLAAQLEPVVQASAPALVPEPVAQASAPALVPEPLQEQASEPIPELLPEPVISVLPEPEREVIVEEPPVQEAPASDAPVFSSVAQFEAAQGESAIEHAPPDDPIMSSFSSAPSNAPDVNSALAYSSPSQEAPVVEPENSGFSWSSTAINAVSDAGHENPSNSTSAASPAPESSPMPSSLPNPWGRGDSSPVQPEVEQRQSAADIWGHPVAPQQTAPATQQPEGNWGAGEDRQMKEAEAQRVAVANASINTPGPAAPASPPLTPSAPAEGAWGQAGGGSPWSNPSAQPAPVDMPPTGGGWGQPTASRQGLPAIPTNFPLVAPPVSAPDAADSDNAGGAWGRSAQGSAGWATQGSPWGDPASQPPQSQPSTSAAPLNPFSQPVVSQPPASQSFAQPAQLPGSPMVGTPMAGTPMAGTPMAGTPMAGTPMAGTPMVGAPMVGAPMAGAPMSASEQQAGDDQSRSSLARAADGALISPVKGRRRGVGTPAAFDWGSADGSSPGNAGDPNRAGGSEDSGDNKKIDDVLKGLFK